MPTDKLRKEIVMTEEEREIIKKRMKDVGMNNMSAYIRRMALYGYVIHLDMSDLKEVLRLMKNNSNNLNQYTKRANETGSVYQEDVNELLQNQRLSDLVCLENGLSVIKPRKPSERERYTGYEKRETLRSKICEDIEIVLLQQPRDFEEFLKLLQEHDYELKSGKHPAVKGMGQKRFIRFRSLGAGYTKEDIEKRIFEFTDDRSQEPANENAKKKHAPKREFDLLIDIQEKMRQGKGGGYTKWATVYNIKQMAQTLLFLQERDIRDYEVLAEKASGASARFHELSQEIKAAEKRMGEIAVLKTHILNYVKTRDVFVEYKKSGYSKKFYAEHESDLVLYKAAREAFNQLPEKKIPKIKDLNVEYAEILKHKKELYSEYRQSKKEMQDFVTAKHNIDSFLRIQEAETSAERSRSKEKENKKNTER